MSDNKAGWMLNVWKGRERERERDSVLKGGRNSENGGGQAFNASCFFSKPLYYNVHLS